MDWLFGDSEMAKVIRNKDWSTSPLGSIELWPQSLKTTVSLCLNSNFPISIIWGPEHIQIYNDGYWPICGEKHPLAMGQNFKESWISAWPVVGDIFEQAYAGKACYLTNQRMFLERFGYLEETFFTFSFSPVRGESGEVEGIFHPVTETTEQMLSDRRDHVLRDITEQTNKAHTIKESANLSIQSLSHHNLDLPFALMYLFDEDGHSAHLISSTGLLAGKPPCSGVIFIDKLTTDQWPIHKLMDKNIIEITDLDKKFGSLICGPYPESIKTGFILPIFLPGQKRPLGVLILGVSTRRALDKAYRTFYEMISTVVTSAFSNANAYEQERKRAEALAEIDRAKTTFFNNISHEFRTPLTLMLAPLDDMLSDHNDILSEKIRTDLQVVYRNCTRLLKLVNNLLDFSRLESLKMEALFEPVLLNEITTDLASSFLAVIQQAGLKLIIECENLKELVYVDKDMWEKIIFNLLSNAFKYTLHGTIHLTLKEAGNHIELVVSDTGVGIPKKDLSKIFERFHRVKGTQGRTHEGAGIGLSLVFELVKLHGGAIQVESELNVGSTFTISIPFGSKHLPADQIKQNILENVADLKYNKSFVQEAVGLLKDDAIYNKPLSKKMFSERIIFVEDNADMRGYVSRLLSEHYEVLAFANGKEALKAILFQPPDIILTDVMMSVMDGLELIKEVRANKEIAATPIILLSARAGQESTIAGIDSGADDYLVKPFSAKELLARIKQQINMLRLRKETSRFKDEFLTNISHDLRTPLTAIIGFASLIHGETEGALLPQQKVFLNRILSASTHMLDLVNELLDITLVESGKIFFRPEIIDLTSISNDVVNTLSGLAQDKNIKLEVRIDCPFSTVKLDVLRLKQVLYNYLSNAIKFTPFQGRVMLRISPHKRDMIRIDVEDNGKGIKPEDLNLLFVKFTQLGADSQMNHKGSGLGLVLTKHIIEAQGGSVEVVSCLGEGSIFSAILPRDMTKRPSSQRVKVC